MYEGAFSAEERARLEKAARRPLLESEIDLLRVLLWRRIEREEEVDEARIARIVDSLGRLMRIRATTRGDGRADLEAWLANLADRALDAGRRTTRRGRRGGAISSGDQVDSSTTPATSSPRGADSRVEGDG